MRNDQPKNISGILRKIKKKKTQDEKTETLIFSESLNTSFGMKLILCDDGHYLINTNELYILSGISDYILMILTEISEKCNKSNSDILINRSFDKALNPQITGLHIDSISIYIRNDISKIIANSLNDFHKQMILAFNALKRPKWRNYLLPGANAKDNYSSLLFPFKFTSSASENEYFILLEYNHKGRFIRLTVDSLDEPFLFLKRIPHRIVTNIDKQNYLNNIDKISEQIFKGILQKCQDEQDEYAENPLRQSNLFEMLINYGLKRLSIIKFSWNNAKLSNLIIHKEESIIELFSKILLLLEDKTFIDILQTGRIIEMVNKNNHVFFEVSRNGACLNISIDKKRRVKNPMEYLDRMPCLKETALSHPINLNNTRILLIHHITSEIVGFLKSLDHLGPEHITTLFIKYKGIASDEILETIFTLQEDRFKFYSLQRINTSESVEGNYVLSSRYSPIENLKEIENELRQYDYNYFNSMKLTAGNLFFREAFKAKKTGQKILLIEDGGYIAPEINRLCLEEISLKNALLEFGIESRLEGIDYFPEAEELEGKLDLWLLDIFLGSLEHTKNGFISMQNIQNQYGKLAYPCCTIAMSILKNSEEARECAISILNAIESIFNGIGRILSNRNTMVLGSSGFIGRNLMNQLSFRLVNGKFCGIDIAVKDQSSDYLEKRSIYDLPEEIFSNIDLIIGMTGISVMKEDTIKDMILYGKKQEIFFASGSTKTSEFEDLSKFLEELKRSEKPRIENIDVSLDFHTIRDKQTGLVQGLRVRIHFLNRNDKVLFDHKDLYLLGDLMPINFLYYGVPTEIIDLIFDQLLKITLGLVKDRREDKLLPNKLLAIDLEIDEHANILT